MNRITGLIGVIAIAIILTSIGGCSSGKSNPVMSNNDIPYMSLPVNEQGVDGTNHNLSGMWTVTFDTDALSAEITLDRALNLHWNVTSLVPTPSIVVTGYDPVAEIIEVGVTIANPSQLDAYDVRLIIFTDSTGDRLMNADSWTALYDVPGGLPINPFKLYPYNGTDCLFEGLTEATRDLSIHIPGGNVSVAFAIDASYPEQCEEPWRISSFKQGKLGASIGSKTEIEVDVSDHQGDVNSVNLYCPEICGEILMPFYKELFTNWLMELENVLGASAGEYRGWILAKSENSGEITLYQSVTIKVYPEGEIPYYPEVVGMYDPFYYGPKDICVQDEYAYVIEQGFDVNRAYVDIVNISDPSNPVSIGHVKFYWPEWSFNNAQDLAVQGDYLYIIDEDLGLEIADISDPWNPRIINVHSASEGRYYGRIAVKGDYIYLGGMYRIKIYNAEDPSDPQLIGELEDLSGYTLEIQGDYLYAGSTGKISVLDISVPSSPVEVGNVQLPLGWTPTWMSVQGDYIGLTAFFSSSFIILNISDPENPFQEAYEDISLGVKGIDIVGDYAYVACSRDGLYVYDLTNPSTPVLAGTIDTTDAYNVAVDGNFAYLMDRTGGMRVIDVTNPEEPSETAQIKRANPENLYVEGDYAWVADGEFGYSVFDVSDSESPRPLVTHDTPGATDIMVRNNYAYIIGKPAVKEGYLKILDITDPFNPVEIGSYTGSGKYESLLLDGEYAYICANKEGLIILDISDPSSPAPASWVDIGRANHITIEGDYAYVTAESDGLTIVDISNPNNAIKIGVAMENDFASDVAVKGNYAYLAGANNGVSVVDISNPYDPQLVASSGVWPDGYVCISVRGDLAYLGGKDQFSGRLMVSDISDPLNPELFSFGERAGIGFKDIQIIDNLAYLICPIEGLKIFELW